MVHFPLTAPTAPPLALSAQVSSSTSIRVRWREIPEADRNGIITVYEVDYVYIGGRLRANTSMTSLELKSLAEAELYMIRVRGYTAAGAGPFSQQVEVMTLEDGE